MSDFDFMSIPKILLILGVITLYLTVTIAILISLLRKKKPCSVYHTDFIYTEKYQGIEKRRTQRLPITLQAHISHKTTSLKLPVIIRNISLNGARCEAQSPVSLETGEKLFLDICQHGELDNCQVHCRLVWQEKNKDLHFLGLEFEEKSKKLENFVSHMKKHTA